MLSSSTFQSSHHGGDSRVIKKSKGKQIKREKRVRLERAVHRAEAVMDQIEQKVERSKTKGRAMKNRKVEYEVLYGRSLLILQGCLGRYQREATTEAGLED